MLFRSSERVFGQLVRGRFVRDRCLAPRRQVLSTSSSNEVSGTTSEGVEHLVRGVVGGPDAGTKFGNEGPGNEVSGTGAGTGVLGTASERAFGDVSGNSSGGASGEVAE